MINIRTEILNALPIPDFYVWWKHTNAGRGNQNNYNYSDMTIKQAKEIINRFDDHKKGLDVEQPDHETYAQAYALIAVVIHDRLRMELFDAHKKNAEVANKDRED